MGWLWLAVIGAAIAGALAAMGVPRTIWSMVGAALMLGATGYALQGSPGLPDQPARTSPPATDDDAALRDLRDRMFGRFTLDGAYLIAADAMERDGDHDSAAQVLIGGIRKIPQSAMLWTGLGTALARHDGNQVSPPALFAFQQAIRLAPEHPAPPFFLGLAYLRAGEFAKARVWWRRSLALNPEGASYRRDIALRLGLLDQYLASVGE